MLWTIAVSCVLAAAPSPAIARPDSLASQQEMARAAVEGCFYPMGEEASTTARGRQLAKQVKKACPEAAKALAEAYELHPSDELIAALVIDFLAQVYTEHGGCTVVPIADLARVCDGAKRFRGSGAEVKAAHAYSAPEYYATFCEPYACQDGKTCPPMREGFAEKCGHK